MKQLTVITSNEPGNLADITSALAGEEINVENIEADGHGRRGVVVLTVGLDVYDLALRTLREKTSCQVFTEDALVVRVEDRPGALAEIATRFKEASVNLRSLHIIRRYDGFSLASLVADDREAAEALVRDLMA
ncbi:MAG: ACT domain-containing protein [Verrucomicrobiales bacterium]